MRSGKGLPDDLLARLDAVILPLGYARKGLLYGRRRDGNVAVLHLAGTASGPSDAFFTANLGVQSERIARVFGGNVTIEVPSNRTHWYRWAGDLDHPDQPGNSWWVKKLDRGWDLEEVLLQLANAILPVLEAHSTDEGLRDDWLVRTDTWLTEAQQLAYLLVLLRDLGPVDRIPGLQQRLRYLIASGDRTAEKVAKKVLDSMPN